MTANAESATLNEPKSTQTDTEASIGIGWGIVGVILLLVLVGAALTGVVALIGLLIYGAHWMAVFLSSKTQLSVPQATFAVLITLMSLVVASLLYMTIRTLRSFKRMAFEAVAHLIARLDASVGGGNIVDEEYEPVYFNIKPISPFRKSKSPSPKCQCGSGRLYKTCCGRKKKTKQYDLNS